MSHHHLTRDEREIIVIGLRIGVSQQEIASRIGRHRSTICREILRNGGARNYSGVRAQNRYGKARASCRRSLKLSDPFVLEILRRGMEKHWSPEQVIHREQLSLSVPTVYRGIRRGLLGAMRPLLRRKGKVFVPKGTETRGKLKDCVSIEQRPQEVRSRTTPGRWEGDTVLGANGAGCVVTLVERVSRYLVAALLRSRASNPLTEAVLRILDGAPCSSITVDNGKEFARHARMSSVLGAPVYFAHPHSPWERGSNENTNGLLREYLPKGKDFRSVSREELDHYVSLLNNRPRKCRGWRTPAEVYREPAPPPLRLT